MTVKLAGRRIALIGGAGFIGHNMALHMRDLGAEVHIIDGLQVNNLTYFSSAHSSEVPNRDLYLNIIYQRLDLLRQAGIPLHAQDARDYHLLSHTLSSIEPHIIIHLAAISHAGRSNKDPYATFDHSLRTLENALDNTRGTKIEQFIYFSSSMVYGNFQTEEVDEDHPLNPIGIYGALKLAGEKMVIAYNQVFDLPYTIIRPSALYGARCVSRRVGQIFIENALMGQPLRVDGDGKERLDFTYIQDLIDGVCLAIGRPSAINQTFNMTYGSSRSIAEMAQIVLDHFPGAAIQHVQRDKLMPFRGTLNIDRARELLAYEPHHPIDVGIPLYIDWYKEFFEKMEQPA